MQLKPQVALPGESMGPATGESTGRAADESSPGASGESTPKEASDRQQERAAGGLSPRVTFVLPDVRAILLQLRVL